MKLQINEIFYTIQGEGPSTGRPSIFIRLAGCNLRCVWCDTKYTWLYSQTTLDNVLINVPQDRKYLTADTIYNKNEEITDISFPNLLEMIRKFSSDHLVITGGEPMLQKERLIDFIENFLNDDFSIEIETNGTISPSSFPQFPVFNVSPKLSNSFNPTERRYKPSVLKEYDKRGSRFKFVIYSKDDLDEVQEIIQQINIDKNKVYLMPEGKTRREIREKAPWIIEICKKYGYNYTHRLHVDIYDDKRGV